MQSYATALFSDRHAAHAAVEQLVQAGFPRDTISLVMSEDTHEREFHSPTSEPSGLRSTPRQQPWQAGVLGAIVASLVALASPGRAALRAAGPLVAAMVRSGEGGPSLSNALVGAGLPEHAARRADRGVHTGAIVVGVSASGDRVRLAQQLLELSGGAGLRAA
jgi:hypothetical protein